MKCNIPLLTIILCTIIQFSFAATADVPICQKAEQAFELKQYNRAITYFLSCRSTQSDVKKLEKLAYSYMVIGNFNAAETNLRKASSLEGFSQQGALDFCKVLHQNNKQDEALRRLNEYLQLHPKDQSAQQLMQVLAKKPEEKQSEFTISKTSFSSGFADFSPFKIKEGLVFSSDRSTSGKISQVTGNRYAKIYIADIKTDEVNLFKGPFQSKYNDGCATFTADGKTVFFTRNKSSKIKKRNAHLIIMTSQNHNGNWSDPLPFPYNQAHFDNAHPAINPSGTILAFSSDRPGGSGGMDLYYCVKEKSGKWQSPRNLGTKINTNGHDLFPSFADDSTIVFSTSGRPGYGGLDLYQTSYSKGKWTSPEILPIPLNSSADDFGLWTNDQLETGWLTSNREGIESIYGFDKIVKSPKEIQLWLTVKDKYTNRTLEGAVLEISSNNKNQNLMTFQNKAIPITVLNEEQLSIIGKWEGLDLAPLSYQADYYLKKQDSLTIYLDLKGFVIRGKTLDNSKQNVADVELKFCPKHTSECIKLKSDEHGNFIFFTEDIDVWQISGQKKDMYCNSIELDVNKINRDSSIFITLEVSMEKVEVNKSFIVNNIYYDYNSSSIREEAKLELDLLVDFMISNPSVAIEISSHTDSRGNDDYNLRLSQKRAESAVNYLIEQNIEPWRLIGKGHGETQIINKCKNNIDCSEIEHQLNRRTEIKILKK
jgi:outer membrane protein OmpA-like peptidoglycan-associated protein